MEEETKLVVEIHRSKILNASLILSGIAVVISLFSIIFQIATFTNETLEHVQVEATPNAPFHVNIFKDNNINSTEGVRKLLNDYVYNNALLSDYNIHPTTEIIADIINTSSFMVSIRDTTVYATNNEYDLENIKKYETILDKNRGLTSAESNSRYPELKESYEKFNCLINDKASQKFDAFGYTIDSGDTNTQWLYVEFKFNNDLEQELKKYMRKSINNYDLSDVEDNGSYFTCKGFQTMLAHAMYNYCNETRKSIYYTFQVKTSRNHVIQDEFPLFIPY